MSAVLSTVASTKQSVRKIQRRGAGLMARPEVGGVTDFSLLSGIGDTRSCGTPGDGIEMSQRVQKRRSFVYGSSKAPGIDQGSSGREKIGGRVLSIKKASSAGRAAPVKPHSPTNQTGRAAVALPPVSGSPTTTTTNEQRSLETVCDANCNKNANTPGSTGHNHADTSGIPGHNWSSELVALGDSTQNMWQAQLSLRRAYEEPEPGAEAVRSRNNRALPQSPDGHRGENGKGDNIAATKMGNILMGLPLSKLKIVIGKL